MQLMTCNCNCNVNCLCKVCFLCYLWVSNKKGRSIQLLTYNIQDLEDYLIYAHLISLGGPVSQCFMDLNFSWWVVYDGEIVFWVHCDGKFARLLFKCLKVQFVPSMQHNFLQHNFLQQSHGNVCQCKMAYICPLGRSYKFAACTTTQHHNSHLTSDNCLRQRECCTVFLPVLFLCSCWPACKTHLFIKTLFIPTIENANLNSFRF